MALQEDIAEVAGWLREARHIVVFSGAGISAESGIPTFRDDAGFWREFEPERFATPTGLTRVAMSEPLRFAAFFRALIEPIAHAEPNPAHEAVAALEQDRKVTVVTQNVDGLHQTAGSSTVYEVHGSMFQVVGVSGSELYRLERKDLRKIVSRLDRATQRRFFTPKLPSILRAINPLVGIGTAILHRPSVVLFGEPLREPDWTRSRESAARCDVLLCIGTSLEVFPANRLPEDAARGGARVVGIGPEEVDAVDAWLLGNAGDVLPRLLEAMKSGSDA
jgi:NAD-dependent deacetylase